jgi:hypothetical protein
MKGHDFTIAFRVFLFAKNKKENGFSEVVICIV